MIARMRINEEALRRAFGNNASLFGMHQEIVVIPFGSEGFASISQGMLSTTTASLVAPLPDITSWADAVPFIHTGADQILAVPDQVERARITAWGAGGGSGYFNGGGGNGGGGGFASADVMVTPGEQIAVVVGGGGQPASSSLGVEVGGGGGGGLTGVFRDTVIQSNAVLVAGGGGGGALSSSTSAGAAGGGLTGQSGSDNSGEADIGGKGGTQSGGAGGVGHSGHGSGDAGSALQGGDGGGDSTTAAVAVGGYGGGGGGAGNYDGGGGGGSGYVPPDAISGSLEGGAGSVPGASTNPLRPAGIGEGATAIDTAGGHGFLTIEWGVTAAEGDATAVTQTKAVLVSPPDALVTVAISGPAVDVAVYASRDGGATWEATALQSDGVTAATVAGEAIIYHAIQTFSGPPGTELAAKIVIKESSDAAVHGIAIGV